MEKLRLLPDVPMGEGAEGAQDGLQFAQYANILARAALDTPEPFTIGVYGGWGSGKTSLMRMVLDLVQDEEGAIGVWFNAWRYEKEEHLIVPLLAAIITEMNSHEDKLKGNLKTGLRNLRDALRGILYGVSIKGKIGIPGISEAELSVSPKDMVDRYEKLSQMATDRILDQSLYFRSFSRLDEISQTADAPKLVIFVDDLDRCFPDKAVALLEGIKLILNQPNITFVLGIAPRIIHAYLTAKYRKDYDIKEEFYEDYLDKLVQLPFAIPDIRQSVEDYVRGLLKREDVFGKIPAKQFREQYEPLVSICGPACKNNPRAIIRFLNRLVILTRVHDQKQQGKPPEQRMRISVVHFGITNALQMKWPSILRACELNRDVPWLGDDPRQSPLCKLLLMRFDGPPEDRELVADLELFAQDEANPEKEVFRVLATDDSLRALLRSKPGREWLAKPDLRREAAATATEVRTHAPAASAEQRCEVPWASTYTSDGWPVYGRFEIKPRANLEKADLREAELSGADLFGAILKGADLKLADLSGAYLVAANLSGANLRGANLGAAALRGASLTEARFYGANLKKAGLTGADLRGAFLKGANLSGADLAGTDLLRADLGEADLTGANLAGARLGGANLTGAKLAAVELGGALYSASTHWPRGFDPAAAGATFVRDE